MQSRSRAVILFRGDPRREERQKHLPARFLSVLHDDLIRTVHRAPGVDLIIASGTGDNFEISSHRETRSIAASTFDAKVGGAVRFAFEAGYESVVLLAGDIVGLTWSVLDDAFARVEADPHSVVVGPSGDGGFYLVGMSRSISIDWSVIPWFTPHALAGLIGEILTRRLDCFITPRLDDIDDVESAANAVNLLIAGVLKDRLISMLRARRVPDWIPAALKNRLVTPLLSPRAPPSMQI